MKHNMARLTALLFSLVLANGAFAQEPKGADEPVGPGVLGGAGGTGGPDAFGYTFADNTTGECAFQFIDISGSGTQVVSGDDVSSGAIALAQPVDIYGTLFTELNMASNGYITSDTADGGPDLSNDCPLPATPSTPGGTTGIRIYSVHDDIVSNNGLHEYFPVCPRPSDQFPAFDLGCNVFHYDESTHFGDATPFDFQVIVYDMSYEIVVQHDDRNPETGSGSTTGLQNGDATIGITFACDTAASIAANSSQCFVHPNPDASLLEVLEVPTLSQWGMILFALVLAGAGVVVLRRRTTV